VPTHGFAMHGFPPRAPPFRPPQTGDKMDGSVEVATATVIIPVVLFTLKKVFDIDRRLARVETKIEIFLNGKKNK